MRRIFDLDLLRFIVPKAQSVSPEFENGGVAEGSSTKCANRSPWQKTEIEQSLGDGAIRVHAPDRGLVTGPKI